MGYNLSRTTIIPKLPFPRLVIVVLLAVFILPGYASAQILPCEAWQPCGRNVHRLNFSAPARPSALNGALGVSAGASLSSTASIYMPPISAFPPAIHNTRPFTFSERFIGSLSSAPTLAPAADPIPPAIDNTWPLTFDDHFDQTRVNWSLWQDGGKNFTNGGNGELQQYVPSACTVTESILKICANRGSVNGRAFTSGELNTRGGFKQAYGYFEFRGQLPRGQGLWPAFWLYDATGETPQEIDVMENLGKDTTTYYMTMHDNAGRESGHAYHGVDLAQGYHRYAVKWTPAALTFYLDDVQQYEVTRNIVSRPMAIFINLAVGGHWPGSPDDLTLFPIYFNVDHVRAWAMP